MMVLGPDFEFRELHTTAEMVQTNALFESIWQTRPQRPHFEPALLTALAHAGNYVVGVFHHKELVGACVGFFGAPAGNVLHSHIAGVRPDYAGQGIGAALKLHQRQWALDRELIEITWTFDPLVSRNAYFNLIKLGAAVKEYVVDFYGSMNDAINVGQPSDRMIAHWNLLTPLTNRPNSRQRYQDVLEANDDGEPEHKVGTSGQLAVAIPPDIEQIRRSAPELARRWRCALRQELAGRLQQGWRIDGFDKAGYYLLTITQAGETGKGSMIERPAGYLTHG